MKENQKFKSIFIFNVMFRLLYLTIIAQIFLTVMVYAQSNTNLKPVYIVPDRETFLYYLSKWSDKEKYPVFIGKDKYTEKFISAYNNGNNRVIEVEKVDIGKINKRLIYKTLIASFNDQDLKTVKTDGDKWDLKKYFIDNDIKPCGIVITDLDSAEYLGGVVLAAFHGQILEFYEPSVVPILGNYTRDTKEIIRRDIISILNDWGFPFKGIGEGVDAITIAMDIPFKYDGGFSLDDAINREGDDSASTFAFTGRLMDLSKGLAVYQAMCSIFLQTSKALFFDRWPREWMRSLDVGVWDLRKKIPCVSIYDDMNKWRNTVKKYNVYDLVFVNAAGNPDQWSGGTLDDIPDSTPVAVNFSHSTSAADPTDYNTIAGRWLQNGAFVYFGSVSEPFAIAFNLSQDIIASWINGDPFAQALEQKEKLAPQVAKPWKLMYIGDPLFYARFNVKKEDDEYYNAVKDSLNDLEDLSFKDAEESLENYLDKERSLKDNMAYIDQAKNLLTEIYELSFVDKIFGVSVFKYYNKDFFRAWLSRYPAAQNIYGKAFANEEKVLELYNQKYAYKKAKLRSGTHLNDLWNANLSKLRNKMTFIPVWKVAGPVDDNIVNTDSIIDEIHNSGGENTLKISNREYDWKEYTKDLTSGNLNLNVNKKAVYYGIFKVNMEKDNKAVLRFIAFCPAKIYIDKEIVLDYGKDRLVECIYKPVELKKGEHTVIVELSVDERNKGIVGLRLSDDNFSPVEGLVFTIKSN